MFESLIEVHSVLFFTSGTVVPSKTKIAYHFSTLVLTNCQQHTLQIEPRDEYGNPTSNSTSLTDEANYSVHVHSVRKLTLSSVINLKEIAFIFVVSYRALVFG